jgi:sensor domain CHASE-containing protein
MENKIVKLKRVRNKRITVEVKNDIEKIREKIKAETGVTMTYVQTFDFLIDFYMKHANVPRTQWAVLK